MKSIDKIFAVLLWARRDGQLGWCLRHPILTLSMALDDEPPWDWPSSRQHVLLRWDQPSKTKPDQAWMRLLVTWRRRDSPLTLWLWNFYRTEAGLHGTLLGLTVDYFKRERWPAGR